jgi:hypothetical protein
MQRIECRISRPAKRQCSKVATNLMEWRSHRTERFLSWNSRLNSAVYMYSLPDLKLLGSTDVGRSPDWVTISPDGKAYVATRDRIMFP